MPTKEEVERYHYLKKVKHDNANKFNQVMQEHGRSETLDTFWEKEPLLCWVLGFDNILFCNTVFENFNDRKESGEELIISEYGQEFLDLIRSMM